jgi:hypothetical protein
LGRAERDGTPAGDSTSVKRSRQARTSGAK